MSPQKEELPPNSKDSEMLVLGCMMTSINSLNVAAELLNADDFYYTEHKIVFSVLKTAFIHDKPADVHLVAEELKRQDKLKAVGGIGFLTTLVQFAGTSAYIDEYAEEVKEFSYRRQLLDSSLDLGKRACSGIGLDEVDPILDKLIKLKQDQLASKSPVVSVGSLLNSKGSEMNYLEKLKSDSEYYRETGKKRNTGLTTGFTDIDEIVGGLRPNELIILGARPAMGKTALAINIGAINALKNGKIVLIFSLEMSWQRLVDRIVSSETAIDSEKIRDGTLSEKEINEIGAFLPTLAKSTIFINEKATASIEQIQSESRRLHQTIGLDLVVIDYLQLLTASVSKYGNRVEEVSKISRGLKNLARELNIPILALSQLNREVEDRPGHRPQLSDLRESGSLEQDSDVVMFLLREEYYNPSTLKKDQAEVIVAKDRNGDIGSAHLKFEKGIQQFSNLELLNKKLESLLF